MINLHKHGMAYRGMMYVHNKYGNQTAA